MASFLIDTSQSVNMGKVRPKLVKKAAKRLVRDNFEKFNKGFDKSKLAVSELLDVPSKRVRNMIAGTASRITASQMKNRK